MSADFSGVRGSDGASGAGAGSGEPGRSPSDGPVDQGIVDLLGALAYGELSAFERMASDARLAPTLGERATIATIAVAEFGHFQRLCQRLAELGADPEAAMDPYIAAVETFHDLTAPDDWLQSLVKCYVGDGIARDFYREVAAYLDDSTRELVQDVLADDAQATFAVREVRAAIAADPRLSGRLALWARRLVGEALTQAQKVAVERESLVRLLSKRADLAELGRLFTRVTDGHHARMQALGLSA